jgi:DNA-binding MarR family transcriptional regulator
VARRSPRRADDVPGGDALFDAVLLSQVRLGIVTVLLARGDVAFSDLKDVLGLTQGNLGIHLQKLEEAAYVEISKEFVDRRPRTTLRLTSKGRAAFLDHVERLDHVARSAKK